LQKEQQTQIDNFNELSGTYKHAQKRISEITIELQELKSGLIKLERNVIAFEAAEKNTTRILKIKSILKCLKM